METIVVNKHTGDIIDLQTNEKLIIKTNKHKDEVAERISNIVKEALVEDYHMSVRTIDHNNTNDNNNLNDINTKSSHIILPPCDITVSPNNINSRGLILIVQGAGDSRFGMWSLHHCIHYGLNEGSMLPFVKQAIQESYEVVICNPNVDEAEKYNITQKASKKATYLEVKRYAFFEHLLAVWNQVIMTGNYQRVFIVAHSYGGCAVLNLIKQQYCQVIEKVKDIAFTDSVHQFSELENYFMDNSRWPDIQRFFKEKSQQFAASELPLGSVLDIDDEFGCECVSAGMLVGLGLYLIFLFFRFFLIFKATDLRIEIPLIELVCDLIL